MLDTDDVLADHLPLKEGVDSRTVSPILGVQRRPADAIRAGFADDREDAIELRLGLCFTVGVGLVIALIRRAAVILAYVGFLSVEGGLWKAPPDDDAALRNGSFVRVLRYLPTRFRAPAASGEG